jgi:hypothetical protein
MTKLDHIVELSAAELDAVAAGIGNHDNLIAADVIVQDINVNVNALTGAVLNYNP